MTDRERRLAVFAAAFAGPRAGPLLRRLVMPGAADAVALAERLAAAPRRDRLAALAAELAPDPRTLRERAAAAAAEERGAIARVFATLAAGTGLGRDASIIARLCRERVSTQIVSPQP